MDNEKRNCKTCKFYKERYTINGNMLTPVGGLCINDELHPKINVPYLKIRDNCENWELGEDAAEKCRESVYDIIKSVYRRLDNLTLILKLNDE